MLLKKHFVTVQEFLDLILKYSKNVDCDAENFVQSFNEFSRTDEMNKKMLANITHAFIYQYLDEEDEKDWSPARFLKDIYECHICVVNISQCYVKGIIPLKSKNYFGTTEKITTRMAEEVVSRIFDKTKRFKVEPVEVPEIKKIKLEQISTLDNARLIDVRIMPENPLSEKTDFLVENIPLKSIILNPYCIGNDLSQNFVLYCAKGYQSTLAADVLRKAGFINVYTVDVG